MSNGRVYCRRGALRKASSRRGSLTRLSKCVFFYSGNNCSYGLYLVLFSMTAVYPETFDSMSLLLLKFEGPQPFRDIEAQLETDQVFFCTTQRTVFVCRAAADGNQAATTAAKQVVFLVPKERTTVT